MFYPTILYSVVCLTTVCLSAWQNTLKAGILIGTMHLVVLTYRYRLTTLHIVIHVCTISTHLCIYTVSHYNFDPHQPILVILAMMLLRVYSIEQRFAIPPYLTTVSTLPGKNKPWKLPFYAAYGVSKTTVLCLAISSTFINQFYKFL